MNRGVAVLAGPAGHAFAGERGGGASGRVRLQTGIGLPKRGRITIEDRAQRVVAKHCVTHGAGGAVASRAQGRACLH